MVEEPTGASTTSRAALAAAPPGTRVDAPVPLAAAARPESRPAATLRGPHFAPQPLAPQTIAPQTIAPPVAQSVRAPFTDEPRQNQARQLVIHLRARHRELRRRQRELQRQAALQAGLHDSVSALENSDEHEHEPVMGPVADHAVLEQRLQTREVELDEFAARLRRREEELDRERAALEQMRAEVSVRNQEALEMRLACEQLWSQLASRMEAPRLIESIAQLRRKISDQYLGAAAELAQQRDEARQLIHRLDDRHKQLRKQREEIQAWVMRRHEELEIQHIELLKRQQELDARERAQQQLQAQVQNQILDYQRKIRQLTAQLRCKQELSRLP